MWAVPLCVYNIDSQHVRRETYGNQHVSNRSQVSGLHPKSALTLMTCLELRVSGLSSCSCNSASLRDKLQQPYKPQGFLEPTGFLQTFASHEGWDSADSDILSVNWVWLKQVETDMVVGLFSSHFAAQCKSSQFHDNLSTNVGVPDAKPLECQQNKTRLNSKEHRHLCYFHTHSTSLYNLHPHILASKILKRIES